MEPQSQLAGLRPEDLPRPPEAALRILTACADPEAGLGSIAGLVAGDPALTADLLRIINSAYFGFDREIASIDLAVSLLGLNALRSRVLCVALRGAATESNPGNMELDAFMEDSVRRAVAARELGSIAQLDPDDAFAAGLLQDFGLLALFHMNPGLPASAWKTMRASLPAERLELERETFGLSHDAVLGELGVAWSLPDSLAQALVAHHTPSPEPGLATVLHGADWINAVFTADNPSAGLHGVETLLEEAYGLSVDRVHALMGALPGLVDEAAASLGVTVAVRADFDALTRDINVRLADDNLSYQELNWQLQQAIRERDALTAERDREMDIAREIQCSLQPSGTATGGPVWGLNVSARVLSGDFDDFFPLRDGRICFTVGDVSGKGLTAALLMAKTSSLFRCLGRRLESVADVMTVLNDELCETSVRGMFVTMIAGVFDPRTQSLELVNAGHPPPLMRNADAECSEIEASLLPLGIVAGTAYESVTLSMRSASLYLYSDGVTEALDDDGRALGLDGLTALLGELGSLPPAERIDAIVARLMSPSGPRHDDLTLAVLDPTA